MLKGKSRIAMLALAGVAATLMVGGMVIGSNTGFKGNFSFLGGEDAWVSPPYRTPYVNADGLLKALTPSASGGTLTRFVATAPPAFQFWNGSFGNGLPANFVLEAGEGYQFRPNVAESNVIIVGSHDPFVTVPSGQGGVPAGALPAGSSVPPGFVANSDYLFSVPWHTTYQNAQDFLEDVGGSGVITRLNDQPGSPPAFEFWNGAFGNAVPANFPIDLGRGYLVRVLTSSSGVIPAHF